MCGRTAAAMKDSTKTIRNTDLANTSGPTAASLKASGRTASEKARAR